MARVREDLVWRRLDEETILLDTKAGRYLSLNGTGSLLWPLLVDGGDAATLEAALRDRFGLSAELARQDVATFIERLREQDLLAQE